VIIYLSLHAQMGAGGLSPPSPLTLTTGSLMGALLDDDDDE